MPDDHTRPPQDHGLHLRMHYEGERIASQHTQLGELHLLVVRALDDCAVHSARQGFERFQEALRAHFEVEERIYFPALHGLLPELGEQIGALLEEHDAISAELPRLRLLLGAGEIELSRERLGVLAKLLSNHESREEGLIEHSIRARGGASRAISPHRGTDRHMREGADEGADTLDTRPEGTTMRGSRHEEDL